MTDSTDYISQVAAKDAEVQVLREKVNKLSEEKDKAEKSFRFILEKYEDLLKHLGTTDS